MNHSQFDRGVHSMGSSIQTLKGSLLKLAGAVGLAFGVGAIINFGKESVKAASELNNAWIGLQSIVEGQGRSFGKAKSFIEEYISDGLVPLTDAVTAYKNLAARGYSDEQIQKTMTALKDAAAFGRQSTYTLGQAISTAAEGLKNENSILVDNAGVTKNVAKMWDDYAKSIGTTANNLTQEQKIQAEVNGILEETRFQAGDAAKLVNTYSGQVAMLGFNFQQLKVQIGNAIMPVVQAVLPGINAIIAALLKLAKVFAKVTALLFGKANAGTVGQVSANEEITSSGLAAADATDKLANSTAGAGSASKKAAKDMKGILAGFDELNILADKASGSLSGAAGGGSGSGVDDIEIPDVDLEGDPFENLEESISSLGALFIKTLDDMLAGIPALKAAFLEFASNFNDFNQKLYDAFTFPGVLERVQELGKELAAAFNDLVNAIDWQLWGQRLGAGLNLGLQFLTEFIYTFDWINLGKKLAEFINGLVYEVDWYDFGRLLWTQFKIGLETFAGFLTGLDMPALAKAASSIIMGFFDEMKNTIAKIDWAEIGRQVARFLSNIDWMGILSSAWGALKEAVLAGFDFLVGVIEEGSPGLLAAVSLIAGAMGVKFATDVVPQIVNVANAFRSFFKKIKDISVLLKYEMANLSGAINAVFGPGSTLAGIAMIVGGAVLAFTNFFSMLQNGFSLANEALMLLGIAITALGAIILGVATPVAAAIAGIVAVAGTLAAVFPDVVAAVITSWDTLRQTFVDSLQPIVDVVSSIQTSIQEWFDQMRAGWENYIQPVLQNIIDKFNEVVQQHIAPLIEQILKLIGNISEVVKILWETILSPFVSWLIGVMGPKIGATLEFIGSVFLTTIGVISDLITGLLQTLNGLIKFLTGVFTGDWEKAFNGIRNTVDGAITFVSGIIDGFVENLKSAVNWLKNFLGLSNETARVKSPSGYNTIHKYSQVYTIGRAENVLKSAPLPRLANGAVIPPNQQFAAILGDQRKGYNIEAPADLIYQMAAKAIHDSGVALNGGGNRPITVILQVDRRELGRVVYEVNTQETQRVGVRLARGTT